MKKILTLASAALLGVSGMSADTYYRMTKELDTFYDAYRDYIWNADGTLQKIDEDLQGPDYREFKYNDKKQCIREDNYQDIEQNGNYTLVNYVEYTYNDKGLLATREHYNSLPNANGEWEMTWQGIYEMTYNDKDQLVKRMFYIDQNKLINAYDETFTYNDKGLLTNMTQKVSALTMEDVIEFVYTYDSNDRLTEVSETSHDDNGSPRVKLTRYTYDEDGNLTEIIEGTNLERPQAKHEFVYSDVPVDKCVFPYTPEEEFFPSNYFKYMTHQPEIHTEYIRADMSDGTQQLAEAAVWEYSYEEYDPENPDAGIEAVGMNDGIALRGVRVIDGQMTFQGVNRVDRAAIYDLNGRMVMRPGSVNGTLDVSSLAKGTYMIMTAQGAAKFVR